MSGQPLEISSSEQDERGAYELSRMNAVAGKGLVDYFPIDDSNFPDLASYFLEFDLSCDEQIKMCRTYASYLSSTQPKKKRRKRSEKEHFSEKAVGRKLVYDPEDM